MKAYVQKPAEVERKWHIVDAKGKTLGRLSTQIASLLRGKGKVTFTPHVDGGDYVIVINAKDVRVSGKKEKQKIYRHHTGYIGHLKEISFEKLIEKDPAEVIRHAVVGMLPKNKTRDKVMKRLKVYAGDQHAHQAQKAEVYEV